MKPLTMYLIRHGEKTLDFKRLTKRGKKQAELLGKRLKKLDIDKIISSDLSRCVETAKIINKHLKLKLISFDPRIREINSYDKILFSRCKRKRKSVKEFLKNILEHEEGNILVVCHGNVNRYILSLLLEIPPKKAKLVQIPTGVNTIERKRNGEIKIVTVNDTTHLPEKLKVKQLI